MHRNRGCEQKILRNVQRLARNPTLHLPANPENQEENRAREQQCCETIDACAYRCGHARHCFRIARDELDKWIDKRKEQQQAIKQVIDSRQIAVLLFVKHHEAVMLLHQVVVGPECSDEEKHETGAGEHQHWSNREKEQRSPEQSRAVLSFGAIEVSA